MLRTVGDPQPRLETPHPSRPVRILDRQVLRVRDIASGGTTLSIVVGQPSCGRTTLLRQIETELLAVGHRVETLSCSDHSASLPFALFERLIDDPHGTPLELLRSVRSTLCQGGTGPTLLLIDDAHHIDDESAALLHQLVTGGDVLAVLTLCSTRPVPSDIATLASSCAAMWVDLGPLDRHGSDELFGQLIGRTPDGRQLETVWKMARGVPAYIAELAAHPVEPGAEFSPSSSLVTSIRARVDRLAGDTGLLIALTMHDRLPEDLCVDAFGATSIRTALGLGLVRCIDIGSTKMIEASCGLVPTVMGMVITGRERSEVAASMLGAVVRTDEHAATPDTIIARAELLKVTGRTDPEAFRLAADVALHRHETARSLDYATRAVEQGAGPAGELTLACAMALRGSVDEAEPIFERIATSADPDTRLRAYRRWALSLLFDAADPERAELVLGRAVDADPAAGARLRSSQLPNVRYYSGDSVGALVALDDWAATGHEMPFDALPGALSASVTAGRPADALTVLESLATWQWGHMMSAVALLWVRAIARWQLGSLAEIRHPTDGLSDIECNTLVDSVILRRVMPASLTVLRGTLRDPFPSIADIDHLRHEAPPQLSAFASALTGMHLAYLGRTDEARAVVDRVRSLPAKAAAGFEWWVDRVEVISLAGEGRRSEAAAAALQLASRHRDERFHHVTSLHDAVQFGANGEARDAMRAFARRSDATWWELRCAEHAAALVDADSIGLARVADRFERGGLVLCALHTQAQAAQVGATAGTAAAQRMSAERARNEMRRLLDMCGEVATLPPTDRLHGLTEREYTVATLAGRGLSNSAIAERLGTSVRTVGNQLQNAYQKLGVHSRNELEPLLLAVASSDDNLTTTDPESDAS